MAWISVWSHFLSIFFSSILHGLRDSDSDSRAFRLLVSQKWRSNRNSKAGQKPRKWFLRTDNVISQWWKKKMCPDEASDIDRQTDNLINSVVFSKAFVYANSALCFHHCFLIFIEDKQICSKRKLCSQNILLDTLTFGWSLIPPLRHCFHIALRNSKLRMIRRKDRKNL